MITSSPQLFSRPGRSSCTWVITLPQGHRVHLWFDALKMDGDSIIVRDGNDSSAPKITIIKSDDYKESIVSSGNNMYLFYKHNGHWTNGTRRGFTASYKTESRTESKWRNTCVRQHLFYVRELQNAALFQWLGLTWFSPYPSAPGLFPFIRLKRVASYLFQDFEKKTDCQKSTYLFYF